MVSLNAKYVLSDLLSSWENKELQTVIRELQSFKGTERSDPVQESTVPLPAQWVEKVTRLLIHVMLLLPVFHVYVFIRGI